MMRRNAVAAMLFSSVMLLGTAGSALAQTAATPMAPLPGQPVATGAVTSADPGAAAALPALPADPAATVPALPGDPAAAAPAPAAMPDANAAPVAPLPGDTSAVPPVAPLPGAPAALPALPGTLALPANGVVTALPGAIPTPVPFGAVATLPGAPALPGQPVSALPTPPSLDQIGIQTADATIGSLAPSAAQPSQLYTFLFIDLDEYGTVRHPFANDVADHLKQQEIDRLAGLRTGPANQIQQTLGVSPMDVMGVASAGGSEAVRAAAEWDFYYGQLEMYDKFVREKLVPGAEELPELEYNAADALQERQDLFESFQEAAIQQSSEDYNANKQFYERLAQREDRRKSYLEWLALSKQQVEDWSAVWARTVYGDRWADGEEVRLDDWYYGKDFNSANPVTVAIDDREYVVSRQPVGSLKDGQLNVVSSNLTPYDIIDANGELKNPVMETLRGTLALPPAPPVYGTRPGPAVTGAVAPTGIIDVVGGVTTE